jgi:hypothetical protein
VNYIKLLPMCFPCMVYLPTFARVITTYIYIIYIWYYMILYSVKRLKEHGGWFLKKLLEHGKEWLSHWMQKLVN